MKNKYVIILSITVLISFVLITSYVVINNRLINSVSVDSLAKSKDIQNNTDISPLSFKLQKPSMDMNTNTSDYLTFYSNIDSSDVETTKISASGVLLKSKNFQMAIYLVAEGNPLGLITPLPEINNIPNFNLSNIKRVNVDKNNGEIESFKYYSIENNYMYFYSNELNTGNNCTPELTNVYCGNSFITLNNDYKLKILCSTVKSSTSNLCNQIVENMEISY